MDDGDNDWDLHAVVRGCAAMTAASATTNNPIFPDIHPTTDQNSFDYLMDDNNIINDSYFQSLQEAYRELCGDAPPPPTITTAEDIIGATSIGSLPVTHNVFQPNQEMMQVMQPAPQMNNLQISQENIQFNNPRLGYSSLSNNFPTPNPPPNRRKMKNQPTKTVRQMTQEQLSTADSWAWRKYGQKPIKGSAHPRNYFRCSTSKGCAARKHVELHPKDPKLFLVSYTGEHTHPRPTYRSSLAGSTRNKFSSTRTSTKKHINNDNKGNLNMISNFIPSTSAENNEMEMVEEEDGGGDEDDQNMFMTPNDHLMMNDDDFFKRFHDYDDHSGGGAGVCF